jgi:hypothetical protein
VSKSKKLPQFPAAYADVAERSLAAITEELRLYMLAMIITAEGKPNRIAIKTPYDVIGLAIEGFSQKLYERAKDKREAKWATEDLLEELGFGPAEGTTP